MLAKNRESMTFDCKYYKQTSHTLSWYIKTLFRNTDNAQWNVTFEFKAPKEKAPKQLSVYTFRFYLQLAFGKPLLQTSCSCTKSTINLDIVICVRTRLHRSFIIVQRRFICDVIKGFVFIIRRIVHHVKRALNKFRSISYATTLCDPLSFSFFTKTIPFPISIGDIFLLLQLALSV